MHLGRLPSAIHTALGKSEDVRQWREGEGKGTGVSGGWSLVSSNFWRWPDLGHEESYLAGAGLCFYPVTVVINIVGEFGNTIFYPEK